MSVQPHVEKIFADYIVEAGCLRDQDVILGCDIWRRRT